MAVLGFPWQMGNVPPGTKLLLLNPDGVTQVIYVVPATVPPFTDLPNANQYGVIRPIH
jgi:hypothetical protein